MVQTKAKNHEILENENTQGKIFEPKIKKTKKHQLGIYIFAKLQTYKVPNEQIQKLKDITIR